MDTAKIAEPISGDKLYQQRARAAVPILVRQALAHGPIYYSDLALELGMPNPRNLNYVLGSIDQTLVDLSKEWDEEIPPIQCLVINKNTGLPGEGIGWFITTEKEHFQRLSRKQQRSFVDVELHKIYSYQRWFEVLEVLSLQPNTENFNQLLSGTRKYQGGGESQEHLDLKMYIKDHPEIFSLPKKIIGETEYPLPSGDLVDVLFKNGYHWTGIEVKSEISNSYDIIRGLFQCIKYHVVIEAYQSVQQTPQNARTILALGKSLPRELIPIKNILGIEVIENIKPE